MKFFKVNHINLIQWSTGQLQSSRVGGFGGLDVYSPEELVILPRAGGGTREEGKKKEREKDQSNRQNIVLL